MFETLSINYIQAHVLKNKLFLCKIICFVIKVKKKFWGKNFSDKKCTKLGGTRLGGGPCCVWCLLGLGRGSSFDPTRSDPSDEWTTLFLQARKDDKN